MSDLLELAACVGAADGPDTAIDRAIFDYLNPPAPQEDNESEPPAGFGTGFLDGAYWGAAYTASIDAAMQLVPDGWRVAALAETVIEGSDPWNARLLEKRFDGRGKSAQGDAATPALALCAAALRARAVA